jgi:mRNA interferase RelE/StbE
MSLKMSYEIIPLKAFQKFFALRTPIERDAISLKIEVLKMNPFDSKNLNIKKLKGYKNRYRLRVWDYRIIYEVHNNELIIILMDGGSRGNIYK